MKRFWISLVALLIALPVLPAAAQESSVISIWGGSWRDMVANIVAKKFTAETGAQVEFITGGTIDRLNKAKLAKGSPETDLTFTTSACRLALRQRRPVRDARPDEGAASGEAGGPGEDQPLPHRHLGLCLHHRLPPRPGASDIAFESWADLWKPEMRASWRRRISIRATSSSSPPCSRAAMPRSGKRGRPS